MPGGSWERSLRARPLRRMNSTSRWSKPSRPIGPCSSTSGTVSAAMKGSSKPRTVRTRKGGLAVRLRVAGTGLAGDAGKLCADQLGIAVADAGESGIDFRDAATGADEGFELGLTGAADGHAGAVVENDVEGFDVVGNFAAEQAVDAATVVADHAAEGAAVVGGRVGSVGEVVAL